nr:unnamed protein product [Digitaria exilis]
MDGGAQPPDTEMTDAGAGGGGQPPQQPAGGGGAGMMENIQATLSHGGRFIQYNIFGNVFEVTAKYKPPILPIGKGAYGIVCSALNSETAEQVAIKKIANAFDNKIDAKRTLREIKLLRHMDHENLIGTPNESDLDFVNENARRYIRQLPRHARQSLPEKFPHVQPLAIDLVEKMLTFDPRQRITVEGALAHPYLASLHDISDEPVCSMPFSFDFEQHALSEEQMKDLIYQEALAFNPDYQ